MDDCWCEEISRSHFRKVMVISGLLCMLYGQLFSGRQNVNMSKRMCVSVFIHWVGDVRAAKQKPSPGFCLAGRFMQLSILGQKGRGHPWTFSTFKNLVYLFWYTWLTLVISAVFSWFPVYLEIIFDFKLAGKNERPPYLAFGSQVCCFLTCCDPFVEVSLLLPFLCLFFASISLDFFRVT